MEFKKAVANKLILLIYKIYICFNLKPIYISCINLYLLKFEKIFKYHFNFHINSSFL